jgi:hypothetical protein
MLRRVYKSSARNSLRSLPGSYKLRLMTLSEWLDEKPGRAADMARHFKVADAAVAQWKHQPPKARILAIHEYTKKRVSVVEMLSPAPRKPAKVD